MRALALSALLLIACGQANDASPEASVAGGKADDLTTDEGIVAWCEAKKELLDDADEAATRALVTQAKELSPTSKRTLSIVRLFIASAYGHLADKGAGLRENGALGFNTLSSAVDADPTYDKAVITFGRAILFIDNLGFIKRTLARNILGIDLNGSNTKVIVLLAQFESSALAQLVRLRLATYMEDDTVVAEASAALAMIRAEDPEEVTKATKSLDGDAEINTDELN